MDRNYKLAVARQMAAEGMVLLKNENGALPLKKDEKVAAFGRTFYFCFKGGSGAADMMAADAVQPYEALSETDVNIDKDLAKFYLDYNEKTYEKELKYWNKINQQWVTSLYEPVPNDELIQEAAKNNQKAILNIGRCAGEWVDVQAEKGGYYLTDEEKELIKKVTDKFEHVVLLLNTYGIIENDFLNEYNFDAILFTSMAGQEMGNGVADILTGKVTPSGKLADTWTRLEDYPTNENFQEKFIPYKEGIYMGYRYFDTFNVTPNFPFGFGLSYTKFDISNVNVALNGTVVDITADVKNIGEYEGKEVLQVYLSEPKGELNKAYQQLAAFIKTKTLKVGETETVNTSFDLRDFAAFKENGAEFILEAGQYIIRVGNCSRNTKVAAVIDLDKTAVCFKTVNRLPIQTEIEELVPNCEPYSYEGEKEEIASAKVISLSADSIETVVSAQPEDRDIKEFVSTGFHTLAEVKEGKCSMEEFVAQFSNEELADILNGVTSDTVNVDSHFGQMAVTVEGAAGEIWSSEKYGIPPCVNADGTCGIRLVGWVDDLDNPPVYSELAKSMVAFPDSTSLAYSWNLELSRVFGECMCDELKITKIPVLLAPAMNLHRNPICGRNFEYYSEDPLMSGLMASYTCLGVEKDREGNSTGIYTTIKHLAANNAEKYRFESDSVMSERTLREIYLKAFQITLKLAAPKSLMASYNKLNGRYTADSYDLLNGILRCEWGFDGMVMTDWNTTNSAFEMVHAGCDVVMPGCKNKDYLEGLNDGRISRAEAQICAKNIMNLIMISCM